jgi:hypothetical protein
MMVFTPNPAISANAASLSGELPEKILVVARNKLWTCVEGSGVPMA